MLTRKNFVVSLGALAAVGFAGAASAAVTFTWTGAAGADWNDHNNWTASNPSFEANYPGDNAGRADDVVYIPDESNDPRLNVALAAPIDGLTIDAGAELDLLSSHDLHITGPVAIGDGVVIEMFGSNSFELDSNNADMVIDGDVIFQDSASLGAPELRMDDSGVVVTINSGAKLTTQVAIRGQGLITGDGMLYNRSQVRATTGVIALDTDLNLDDDNGAVWAAEGTGAKLEFEKAVSTLVGGFEVASGGRLGFEANVTTSGSFSGTCGDVDLGGGIVFTYNGGADNCS